MSASNRTQQVLSVLGAREIAALYLGHRAMLQDLQELQLQGKRIPGGLSRRIEIASGYLSILEDGLRELKETDPDKFIAIWEWLEYSPQPSLRRHALQMKASAQPEAA